MITVWIISCGVEKCLIGLMPETSYENLMVSCMRTLTLGGGGRGRKRTLYPNYLGIHT